MANFKVPYLVGNTYKRDHQLWPTILRTELLELMGGDTPERRRQLNGQYPIGLTLAQMMGVAWRVRTWKIATASFSFQTTVTDDPVVSPDDFAVRTDTGTTPEFSFDTKKREDPAAIVPQIDLASERDILADWRNWPLAKDYVNPPSTAVPIWKTLRNLGIQDACNKDENEDPIQITDTFSFADPYNHAKFGEGGSIMINPPRFYMNFGYVIYDPDAKLFYPQIFLGFGGFGVETINPGAVAYFMLNNAPFTTGNRDVVLGQCVVSFGLTGIPSFQIPIIRTCPLATSQSGITPGTGVPWTVSLVRSGDFDLVMTPTKFWPYLNSLGEECYDEDDGHQINEPFA